MLATMKVLEQIAQSHLAGALAYLDQATAMDRMTRALRGGVPDSLVESRLHASDILRCKATAELQRAEAVRQGMSALRTQNARLHR